MTNQDVIIYLNTPLISMGLKPVVFETPCRLRGKILSENPQGFVVQLKTIGNEKGWSDQPPPIKKIFLPVHKIDFMVLD